MGFAANIFFADYWLKLFVALIKMNIWGIKIDWLFWHQQFFGNWLVWEKIIWIHQYFRTSRAKILVFCLRKSQKYTRGSEIQIFPLNNPLPSLGNLKKSFLGSWNFVKIRFVSENFVEALIHICYLSKQKPKKIFEKKNKLSFSLSESVTQSINVYLEILRTHIDVCFSHYTSNFSREEIISLLFLFLFGFEKDKLFAAFF